MLVCYVTLGKKGIIIIRPNFKNLINRTRDCVFIPQKRPQNSPCIFGYIFFAPSHRDASCSRTQYEQHAQKHVFLGHTHIYLETGQATGNFRAGINYSTSKHGSTYPYNVTFRPHIPPMNALIPYKWVKKISMFWIFFRFLIYGPLASWKREHFFLYQIQKMGREKYVAKKHFLLLHHKSGWCFFLRKTADVYFPTTRQFRYILMRMRGQNAKKNPTLIEKKWCLYGCMYAISYLSRFSYECARNVYSSSRVLWYTKSSIAVQYSSTSTQTKKCVYEYVSAICNIP